MVTGRPGPRARSSPRRLFPRYVQEVIQRGRSCARPACTPVLSVVPAVSDLELSETEYVRPQAPGPAARPRTGPGAPRRRAGAGRPQASRLCQGRRGPPLWDTRATGRRGSSGPSPRLWPRGPRPTCLYFPELPSRALGLPGVRPGASLPAWPRGRAGPGAVGTRSLALCLRGTWGLGLGTSAPQAGWGLGTTCRLLLSAGQRRGPLPPPTQRFVKCGQTPE